MPENEVVVVSPVTGEPLTRRKDGFYEAANDKQLYIYVEDKLTPLVSPSGKPMVPSPIGDSLFYCESEGMYYQFTHNDLVKLISPIDNSPLVPDGKGGFDSESDDLVYEIHNGVVVALKTPDDMPIVNQGDGTYYCEADHSMYEITEKGRVNKVTEEELARRAEAEAEYYNSLESTSVVEEEDEDMESFNAYDCENLYGYDVETANIVLNSVVLGELPIESIIEAFDSLGLPYNDDLFTKLEKARRDFQDIVGDMPLAEHSNNNNAGEKTRAEEIEDQFKLYNTPAFMDPIKAYKLNREYRELTGDDNERFLDETPSVIATLNRDRDTMARNGAFDSRYFGALGNIEEYVKLKRTIHYENSRAKSAA